MPETIFGLPLHPLIVHATVVVVPTAALVILASVFSKRFRDWAGILPLALAVGAVILTPLSTSTGESLEHMVGESALIEKHAHYADLLIWWAVGMLLVAGASWFLRRGGKSLGSGAGIALMVAGAVVAAGTMVQVVLIGHSGAKSAWGDVAKESTSQNQNAGDGD